MLCSRYSSASPGRDSVEANHGFQKLRAQDGCSELFLVRDDLQEDAPGDILSSLVFDHLDRSPDPIIFRISSSVTWRLSVAS